MSRYDRLEQSELRRLIDSFIVLSASPSEKEMVHMFNSFMYLHQISPTAQRNVQISFERPSGGLLEIECNPAHNGVVPNGFFDSIISTTVDIFI